jgi:hypothetical protein
MVAMLGLNVAHPSYTHRLFISNNHGKKPDGASSSIGALYDPCCEGNGSQAIQEITHMLLDPKIAGAYQVD